MEIVSRNPRMPRPSILATQSSPACQDQELSESSADTHARQDQQVSELTEDLLKMIFAKLPLREFVCLHFGSSQEWRAQFTSSRVFEGEPFFLRGNDPVVTGSMRMSPGSNHWFYAYSMQKWIQLQLPISVSSLFPVSASGGLVLFSRELNNRDLRLGLRRPLEVVNPIKREHRSLSLPPIEPPVDSTVQENMHLGLRVSADSNTYKVVVHWMDHYVVQIFDSGSGRWSTVQIPREYIPYANSSNEIVFCRKYELLDEAGRTSVFDIRHEQLVNYYRDGFTAGLCIIVGDEEEFMIGYPTAIDSCIYVLGYRTSDPFTSIHIHKRERSSITWQLVTEVPLDILRRCLEVDEDEFQSFEFRDEGTMELHECGNHLLFTAAYGNVWCGMLYDLDKQEWIRHYIIDENWEDDLVQHGLFFQPQLNGPPC